MGNAPEQLEAALVDSLIKSVCEQNQAKEVKRTFVVDENGVLVIESTLILPLPLENIVIDLNNL